MNREFSIVCAAANGKWTNSSEQWIVMATRDSHIGNGAENRIFRVFLYFLGRMTYFQCWMQVVGTYSSRITFENLRNLDDCTRLKDQVHGSAPHFVILPWTFSHVAIASNHFIYYYHYYDGICVHRCTGAPPKSKWVLHGNREYTQRALLFSIVNRFHKYLSLWFIIQFRAGEKWRFTFRAFILPNVRFPAPSPGAVAESV